MNTTDDNTDIKFRRLFEKAGLESPSAQFTGSVMDRIGQLSPETVPVKEKKTMWTWLGRIGIVMMAVGGLVGVYLFNIQLFPESFKPVFDPVFSSVIDSFKGIFGSMKVSSTTIVIILGFVLLIVIERIFSRSKFSKNLYLYFY